MGPRQLFHPNSNRPEVGTTVFPLRGTFTFCLRCFLASVTERFQCTDRNEPHFLAEVKEVPRD